MSIEEELFKSAKVDFNKIVKYGFTNVNSNYQYTKNITDNTFRIIVEINNIGEVKGKVFDLSFGEEYTNFRVKNSTGSFANQVKDEFINLLKDIRDNCCTIDAFLYDQSNRIAKKIKEKYGDNPKFEWEKYPGYAIFRNSKSKKWYGIIMNIDKFKLDKKSNGEVEIINLKLEPGEIANLLKLDGFYPAYHMNKKSWISIILDNTILDENLMNLIEKSHAYTILNKNTTNEWIIPANPKYFDIEKALRKNNTIIWKQSTDIKINDLIYLYVAAPYSSIMYKFKVNEVNIPYNYKDKNLKIKNVMKIELLARYENEKISFSILKTFGINAIRGPRYMPLSLSKYINSIKE